MTNSDDLLKKADMQKIAREGAKIYTSVKDRYDPGHIGKFLAIEIAPDFPI